MPLVVHKHMPTHAYDSLSSSVAAAVCTGEFELLSKSVGVPLVAFRLKPRVDENGEARAQLVMMG